MLNFRKNVTNNLKPSFVVVILALGIDEHSRRLKERCRGPAMVDAVLRD